MKKLKNLLLCCLLAVLACSMVACGSPKQKQPPTSDLTELTAAVDEVKSWLDDCGLLQCTIDEIDCKYDEGLITILEEQVIEDLNSLCDLITSELPSTSEGYNVIPTVSEDKLNIKVTKNI